MEISKRKEAGVDKSNGGVGKEYDDKLVVEETKFNLRKEIGLPTAVALIVGTIIGSGIFVSPRAVLKGTGSVAASLLVWAACGFISLGAALCYAELGTSVKKSGGPYAFIYEGINRHVAFLSVWMDFVANFPGSQAVKCLTFATYIATLWSDDCGPPVVMIKFIAIATILVIAVMNVYSVTMVARAQIVFTIAKVLALVIIIIGGIFKLAQGKLDLISTGFEGTSDSPSSIALSFYSGMFAYGGCQNLLIVTEELKNPIRNIPRSIWISLPLVIVVYMLTNVSYMTVLAKDEILTLPAVAAEWGDKVLLGASFIIPLAVACSTYGSANGAVLAAARVAFAGSREEQLPEIFSYVQVRRYTPVPAILVTTMLIIMMICVGDILALLDFLGFIYWIFVGLTMISLLALRYRRKDLKRPVKVPLVIPIVILLVCLFLLIAPIVEKPSITFLYAIMFMLSGYIFYVPFLYFRNNISCLDKLLTWIQLFLEVAPTDYDPTEWESSD